MCVFYFPLELVIPRYLLGQRTSLPGFSTSASMRVVMTARTQRLRGLVALILTVPPIVQISRDGTESHLVLPFSQSQSQRFVASNYLTVQSFVGFPCFLNAPSLYVRQSMSHDCRVMLTRQMQDRLPEQTLDPLPYRIVSLKRNSTLKEVPDNLIRLFLVTVEQKQHLVSKDVRIQRICSENLQGILIRLPIPPPSCTSKR